MKLSRSLVILSIALAVLPAIYRDPYLTSLLILCMVWSIVTSCWNLQWGYAGIFAFAPLAFLGLGGYASSYLGKSFGLTPWIGMIIGGAVAAGASLVIGSPSLRLKGTYVALVTVSFQQILWTVFESSAQWGWGGPVGIHNVGDYAFGNMNFNAYGALPYYYLALALFVIAEFILYRIIVSPMGDAFRAIRDNEELATCRGVSPYKYKLLVFAITSFIMGLTGAFYAHFTGGISPASLTFALMISAVFMLIIGGLGTYEGPIIGSFFWVLLSNYLEAYLSIRMLTLGVVLVLLVIYAPEGLVHAPARVLARLRTSTGTASKTA
jgi:branched-chain amino acid transport system permease protein